MGTAVLTGALVVGDSVDFTLRSIAESRLGQVALALTTPNRFFRERLADDLESTLGAPAAAVLEVRGAVVNPESSQRANRVHIRGVDQRFWKLAPDPPAEGPPTIGGAAINKRLADQLGVEAGSEILFRAEKPSELVRDAPLAVLEDLTASFRMNVVAVLSDSEFGRFSLQANQVSPYNAFVSLSFLQDEVEKQGQANLLLVGERTGSLPSVEAANEAMLRKWQLSDANLELREVKGKGVYELWTNRIFLDPPIAEAALGAASGSAGVLSYFVNRVRVGERSAPYSMASSMAFSAAIDTAPLPRDLKNEEAVINEWLAEDLAAKPGDEMEISYFVLGPMRQLIEKTKRFLIRQVVPLEGAANDPDLMPPLPGLHGSENCRDWDPGFPVDLDSIRDRDEEYWDRYRGTPKIFVTLKTGQGMWGNRFGNLTAIRFPADGVDPASLESKIRNRINPASIGLFFQPVRERASAASGEALDFGPLFLGLSFFLIVAAVVLIGLLFAFGVEQRSEEAGTLMALGFRPRQVRRLFLTEGFILSCIGGITGTVLGLWYSQAVLYGLSTIWMGAVAKASIEFHFEPSTIVIGLISGTAVAFCAIWLTVRKQARRSARDLLSFGSESASFGLREGSAKTKVGFVFALLSGVTALSWMMFLGTDNSGKTAGAFFGAGALLLIACLSLSYGILSWIARADRLVVFTLASLGMGNTARRRGRSLATVALLACGTFLVIAVGANRKDPLAGAELRSSGTGGFALLGESTIPVFQDLNSEEGLNDFGLSKPDLEEASFVQIRVRQGDDASCLNLNRPQTPRLLGVDPETLVKRGAFTFVQVLGEPHETSPWSLLDREEGEDIIPAIADQGTVLWALGKKVGDTVEYQDERGQLFRVRIVGALANSILQGNLLISERNFVARYPSESGYQMFLIDAAPEKSDDVSSALSAAFEDVGLEVIPTPQRLAEFNAVESTYLSIYQSLGALGLLIGSVGLGVIVLRNVLERRSEMAVLRAVGFRMRSIHWLVLSEHWLLLILGLGSGTFSGIVAVLPALQSTGGAVPYVSLGLILAALAANGVLWIWAATIFATRGRLVEAIRKE